MQELTREDWATPYQQFSLHRDAVAHALTQELATVRDQLHQALTRLATYTTEFVGDKSFAPFQLLVQCHLPDAGGYNLARGPLLDLGAGYTGRPLHGAQGDDAHYFHTPRVPLRALPLYVDCRSTYFRQRTSYLHPA